MNDIVTTIDNQSASTASDEQKCFDMVVLKPI